MYSFLEFSQLNNIILNDEQGRQIHHNERKITERIYSKMLFRGPVFPKSMETIYRKPLFPFVINGYKRLYFVLGHSLPHKLKVCSLVDSVFWIIIMIIFKKLYFINNHLYVIFIVGHIPTLLGANYIHQCRSGGIKSRFPLSTFSQFSRTFQHQSSPMELA